MSYMNLGVDIRCLQDKWRTGVGEYVWQTLKELAKDKSFNLTGFANAAGKIDLPPDLSELMKLKRGHLPNKIMNLRLWLKLGGSIDQIITSNKNELDVFWLPNPSFAHISKKLPTVLTVHDLSFIHYPHFFPNKGKFWYFPAVRSLLKNGLPDRSVVAAVSEHTAQDIRQEFPNLKSKIQAVPPGLNQDYFLPVDKEELNLVKKKYDLPEKYLLSLGTIEPRKNYSLLLRVYDILLKQNSNFPYSLVIAGSWGWRYKSLVKQFKQLDRADKIKFIGYVADEDKKALYSGAELFLFPSLYEGIGLPPLEAMAAGVPVVVSHASSLPEVVGEAGILLSPYLAEAWVDTINWLINDSVAKNQLKQRGQARAKLFSWSNTAQAYKQIFNDLIRYNQ